jgi:uncharacterized protein (TIGR02246 family)
MTNPKTMNTQASNGELEQLERKYWQAVKDQDARTCAELSDDPSLVTGAQGVSALSRDQMRAMMEKDLPYTLDEFELKDMQVRMLGPDMGVVAYKVHEKLTVDGKPVTLEAADASTWVRRDGKWVCALHTESILGDPFGRDRS